MSLRKLFCFQQATFFMGMTASFVLCFIFSEEYVFLRASLVSLFICLVFWLLANCQEDR